MSYKPPRRPQFFYTTAPLPCPYVPGRTERKIVTELTGASRTCTLVPCRVSSSVGVIGPCSPTMVKLSDAAPASK